MGSVFKKTVTRPIPAGAELFTKAGQQFARWKPRNGRAKVAPVISGANGQARIRTESSTYVASFVYGQGVKRVVSTGCRDEGAARSVLHGHELRAVRVMAGLLSPEEDAISDHQAAPIAEHFEAYMNHLQAKGTCHKHRGNVRRQIHRVAMDCRWKSLRDLGRQSFEAWLSQRMTDGMSARTRNAHRAALVAFSNWCIGNDRLLSNPFTRVSKSNEKADPRRKRRALTNAELGKLLIVSRWRSLAEEGRMSIPSGSGKRSNWSKAELTFDGLAAAVAVARERLASNPEYIESLDRLGLERALILKTLVSTGLRLGELRSITRAQVDLAASCLHLNARDEKNRQGATIHIRPDLVANLREWLAVDETAEPSCKLFYVPTGMIRIFNRDLETAGIAKRDDRGQTSDVHGLRTTFASMLSQGGVHPRTAQEAMRHSDISLTMGTYTDTRVLDVAGAMNSLPELSLGSDMPGFQPLPMDRTGESLVAVTVAPNPVSVCPLLSIGVIESAVDAATMFTPDDAKDQTEPKKTPSFAGFANDGDKERVKRFELSTYSLGSCHSTN